MAKPSTKTLDHIVHLTPPGTLEETSQNFKDLGFNVLPGGIHQDGLTENCLIVFQDHVYLELISFTHPLSHYPPSSPERQKRESHYWATKSPGWIDYGFLGDSATSISEIINKRAEENGSRAEYLPDQKGGRETPDGEVLEWVIAAPGTGFDKGTVPFFCGDVTPREWRVPVDPPSNTQHPSTALGIAHVRILVDKKTVTDASNQLTLVVGSKPVKVTATAIVWALDTPATTSARKGGHEGPQLILTTPMRDDEHKALKENGPGIYEVAFWKDKGHGGHADTPYGKVVWCPKNAH